jgi:hypothetical protein
MQRSGLQSGRLTVHQPTFNSNYKMLVIMIMITNMIVIMIFITIIC